MKRICLGFVLALLGTTACAPSVKTARMQDVKKAAIVGYHIEGTLGVQVASQGLVGKKQQIEQEETLGNGPRTPADLEAEKARQKRRETLNTFEPRLDLRAKSETHDAAAAGYDSMANVLKEKFDWDMVSLEVIAHDDLYTKLREEYQESNGFMRRPPGVMQSGGLLLKDFMWSHPPRRLSLVEQNKLMESLGVDALVTVLVRLNGGIGFSSEDSPQFTATIDIEVYDGVDSEVIWNDGGATGKTSIRFSRGATPEEYNEALKRALKKALGHSYETLFARYEEASKKAS